MKIYYENSSIGKVKYIVNFHDGVKTHKDGSKFFDIRLFTNKVKKQAFINKLISLGYVKAC